MLVDGGAKILQKLFGEHLGLGLLVMENATLADCIKEGDEITVAPGDCVMAGCETYPLASLPKNLLDILDAGGLVKAMQRLNGIEPADGGKEA